MPVRLYPAGAAGGTPSRSEASACLSRLGLGMLFNNLPVIPASVQHHIANLIEGKMGQVGRPKLHPIRVESEQHRRAEKLVREVRRLKVQFAGSNKKAFARYCELHGGKPSSIERRYWDALKLYRKRRQEMAGYVRRAAQLLGEHPIRVAKRMLRQK
jgi:hypothetical protein